MNVTSSFVILNMAIIHKMSYFKVELMRLRFCFNYFKCFGSVQLMGPMSTTQSLKCFVLLRNKVKIKYKTKGSKST